MRFLLLVCALWLSWRLLLFFLRRSPASGPGGGRDFRGLLSRLGSRGVIRGLGLRPGLRVLVVGPLEEACGRELALVMGSGDGLVRRGSTEAAAPLSFPDGSFDRIWLFTTLGAAADPAALLAGLLPVLAPGGLVAVTEAYRPAGAIGRAGLVSLLEGAGFREVEHEEGLGFHTARGRKARS